MSGFSGEECYQRVLHAREVLAAGIEPLVLVETDPMEFASRFFAAVSLCRPVVLANPSWGTLEREEFGQLMAHPVAPGSILIPTGGTTGGVKLAVHDWGSLSAGARATQTFLGGGPVHSLCRLPLYHVSGLMQLIRAFVSGGSVCFDPEGEAGRCLSLVPTQLHRLIQSRERIQKLNTAKCIFIGGAAMSEALKQRVRELRIPVVPVYGMTETAAMIAVIPQEDFLSDPEAGALPLGDAEICIDPDQSIRVRGGSLFQGYHGREPWDRAEGYRTGDAGWIDPHGRLHLMGRMDTLINTGGEKVDPSEVRSALLQLEGVMEATVCGEPSQDWGYAVVAHVRVDSRYPNTSEAGLLRALKKRLSPFKVPKRIRFIS